MSWSLSSSPHHLGHILVTQHGVSGENDQAEEELPVTEDEVVCRVSLMCSEFEKDLQHK